MYQLITIPEEDRKKIIERFNQEQKEMEKFYKNLINTNLLDPRRIRPKK